MEACLSYPELAGSVLLNAHSRKSQFSGFCSYFLPYKLRLKRITKTANLHPSRELYKSSLLSFEKSGSGIYVKFLVVLSFFFAHLY